MVVGISGSTGLAVVRALAHAGVKAAGAALRRPLRVSPPGWPPAAACPDWRGDPGGFLDFLLAAEPRLNEDGGRPRCSSADDSALGVVWEARERLAKAGLLPAFSFVARRTSHRQAGAVAGGEAAGVDIPGPTGATPASSPNAPATSVPLLVKPAVSHDGVKAIGARRCAAPTPASCAARSSAPRASSALVQDFVPGGDDQLYTAGVFRGGGRVLVFTGRKLKQHPPTLGIARLSEALEVPEIVAGSVRLCAELGYEGVAQVEYKRDARDGAYRLMEVNFRPWTWIGLATACGVPLVAAAHAWALGGTSDAGRRSPRRTAAGRWPGSRAASSPGLAGAELLSRRTLDLGRARGEPHACAGSRARERPRALAVASPQGRGLLLAPRPGALPARRDGAVRPSAAGAWPSRRDRQAPGRPRRAAAGVRAQRGRAPGAGAPRARAARRSSACRPATASSCWRRTPTTRRSCAARPWRRRRGAVTPCASWRSPRVRRPT